MVPSFRFNFFSLFLLPFVFCNIPNVTFLCRNMSRIHHEDAKFTKLKLKNKMSFRVLRALRGSKFILYNKTLDSGLENFDIKVD